MLKKRTLRVFVVVMCASMLVFSSVGTAFAYNFYNEGTERTWQVNPVYRSNNACAFNQNGYLFADCWSWMNIMPSSVNVSAGAITSQAGMTVGNRFGQSTMIWGDAITNTGTQSVLRNVTSELYHSITFGEGASAWGYGKVRSNDGSMHEVTSTDLFLIALTDPGPIGPTSENTNATTEWTPEKDNFIGSDGLVYGVPYKNEAGETVMPDMGRVEATNGVIGYISIDSMDNAIYNGATTTEEIEQAVADNMDLEARAFQQAFDEYFGVDALSYNAALECIEEIRYEGGEDEAIAAMENDSRTELAEAIVDGVVAEDKAQSVLSLDMARTGVTSNESINLASVTPEEVAISQEAFKAIYEIARSQMIVSVPVYAENGETVVGEYQFGRL